ncbi:hypothetical protein ABIA35_006729 [Catenulispora sp. MAP12-49]|uniref:hypothetical protein n=1 Tax=unclassified Catenulispora TaxID=414885 RepID=UPI003517F423
MTPLIDFADQALINFLEHDFVPPSHHGFRWINIKRFRIPAAPADERLLSTLIDDGQFEDGYIGGGADPGSGVHGPYHLGRITPAAYQAVDVDTAIGELDTWARQLGALPPTLADVLEEEVYAPIRRAGSRYRLAELGQDAMHDLGFIPAEFHEIVIVAPEVHLLTLIVAADD